MERLTRYLISDAAKLVEVESHVLRYWEEELGIPIKRNELGHRYYTEQDIDSFREIKKLKEQGLQLKAIRMIVHNGKLEQIKGNASTEKEQGRQMIEIIASKDVSEMRQDSDGYSTLGREEKSMRLQILLQHMIAEAVKESNKELCDDIKESVLKEMDYQFRLQEEREEAREVERSRREDEHYRKIDELLRNYSKKGKKKEGEKQSRFSARKKPSIV
ncbi:MAG: MerR family transcriptional regulator [Clostridiales bacterium]|nr:MerR family transcriptional regulator [Clostridiales bacterium]